MKPLKTFPYFLSLTLNLFLIGFQPSAYGALAPELDSCGMTAGETLYSARFAWKSGTENRRIEVVRNPRPRFNDSKVFARIIHVGDNGNTCEAVCHADQLEVRSNGKSAQANSLELSCRSAAFGALAAPATVFFHDAVTGRKEAVLRFGTWLHGYDQAILTIDVDRSVRLIREFAPSTIQLAKSQ